MKRLRFALIPLGVLCLIRCGVSDVETGDDAYSDELGDALLGCSADAGTLAAKLEACFAPPADGGHHQSPIPCLEKACGGDGGHVDFGECIARACPHNGGGGGHMHFDGGFHHHHPGHDGGHRGDGGWDYHRDGGH
jgi:hypothetical protein